MLMIHETEYVNDTWIRIHKREFYPSCLTRYVYFLSTFDFYDYLKHSSCFQYKLYILFLPHCLKRLIDNKKVLISMHSFWILSIGFFKCKIRALFNRLCTFACINQESPSACYMSLHVYMSFYLKWNLDFYTENLNIVYY